MRCGRRLAVDLGSVRIGVASCDPDGLLASPMTTVRRGSGDLAEIARLATQHGAIEIVLGLPTGLDGRPGRAAAQARVFAGQLAAEVDPLPVRLVDERFTTVLADAALARGGRGARDRRAVIDQAAAATLLQAALDSERLTGRPAGELVGSAPTGGDR